MTNIIFHDNHLGERGTTIALYDYAYYAREYLNINPIITYNLLENNNKHVISKFKKQFEILGYQNFKEVQTMVDKKNIENFYAIKFGNIDNTIVKNCRNLIHSVFTSDISQIHGDVYGVISEWLSMKSKYRIPYIPHMINLPNHMDDYKVELGIPKSATVIGRYGSIDTFNIPFVYSSIAKILESRNDIWFLFLNTPKFIEHERCLYFDIVVDLYYKVKFINTCDAMIHARDYGETFGLSVLEFASKNKQIITYDNEELQSNHFLGGRNHFMYLKDNCFKYSDENELNFIFENITRHNPYNTLYLNEQYSPENVMNKFKEVFL